MGIVSSVIAADDVQADGRRSIREHHTDDRGIVYSASYLGLSNTDANTVMLARVPEIENQAEEDSQAVAQAVIDVSADTKTRIYVDGLSDVDAKTLIGYTDEELQSVRDRVDRPGTAAR